MPHALPPLPYAYNALEPHIDARTMELHHGKHHQAYVDNLNKALAGTGLEDKPLDQLMMNLKMVPEKTRMAARNNAGGHYNHSLFWTWMKPNGLPGEASAKTGGGEPSGPLAEAINKKFGSFTAFTEQFNQSGLSRFGSGWVWLVKDKGDLHIISTPNQDNPLMDGITIIFGVDVWEHAYYLNYQNRRADYLKAWWNLVNWSAIEKNYQ